MIPKYIKKSEDLVTIRDDIKNGFLFQAIKKGEISEKIVERAKDFYIALEKVKTVDDVLSLDKFYNELCAAAGLSQKSLSHLLEKDVKEIMIKVFHRVIKNSNTSFREEIVYRYLITAGDSIGGSMRNIIGSVAGEKLNIELLKRLRQKGYKPKITQNQNGKAQSIQWGNRYIIFDHKPKLIEKNIDLILINTKGLKEYDKNIFNDGSRYLACGELKGGIDPAGADEHWKTANSALERIRVKFKKIKNKPGLFFIGTAIEIAMAKEIFKQLKNGKLSHAANFNNEKQVKDLIEWLINL